MPASVPPNRHVDAQSRRRFLHDSSLMVAGSLSLSRAAHVSGDERIRVGLVGCGRQGTRIARQLLQADKAVGLYAMADMFPDHLQACYRGLNSRCKKQCQVSRDHQFVGRDGFADLVETDIDLVVLAATPFFLPSHFNAAVNAGTHVFVEPPLAADVAGVQQILAANEIARQFGLCVDVGFQKRYDQRCQETVEKIASGILGELLGGELRWVGGSPKRSSRHRRQSELEFRLRNWRHHEGLGGHPLLERQIHSLDIVSWILGEQPTSARRIEMVNENPPPSAGCSVEFIYPSGLVVSCHTNMQTGSGSHISECLYGTLGSAQLDAGIIRNQKGETVWRSSKKNGAHPTQMADLLAAIRQGTGYNSLASAAAITVAALMGRSVSSGQPIQHLKTFWG